MTQSQQALSDEWIDGVLVELLGSDGSRHHALARALRAAIVGGVLPVGARLPPQRELARLLAVGRTTVVSAYNLLLAESLLSARQGSGTWVVGRPAALEQCGPAR
jgi:DNA-binding GntR family transcriptional regulator